jgi:hypothetical protein
MMNSEHWLPVWRGLVLCLLRDGYISTDALLDWAKKNKFPPKVIRAAAEAMACESFQYNGATYWRLSGKVVPILPRDVPYAVTYRQAGGSA